MSEAGFAGFDHSGFVGLAAPGKTPAPILAFLNKQLNEAIGSPAFRQRLDPLGMTVPNRRIRRKDSPSSCAARSRVRPNWPSSPATRRSIRSVSGIRRKFPAASRTYRAAGATKELSRRCVRRNNGLPEIHEND